MRAQRSEGARVQGERKKREMEGGKEWDRRGERRECSSHKASDRGEITATCKRVHRQKRIVSPLPSFPLRLPQSLTPLRLPQSVKPLRLPQKKGNVLKRIPRKDICLIYTDTFLAHPSVSARLGVDGGWSETEWSTALHNGFS